MAEHTVALITDSGCDLPDDLLAAHEIDLVPLYIHWGAAQLRDRVDIQPGAFYTRLTTDPVHPTTSQPAASDFVTAIEQAAERGAQAALVVTISSGMSSTHNAAMQAAQTASIPVRIVDSRANSMSQGWQVLAAAEARASGGDLDAMCAAVEYVQRRVVTRLYVDTLEYLHRGGRITRTAKWVGMALNIKPLLQVNHSTGTIEPRARLRSRSQAVDRLVTDFFATTGAAQTVRLALLHGNVPAEAEMLARRIQAEYDPAELIISTTSPVMGVHTGPGALALCGYAAEDWR